MCDIYVWYVYDMYIYMCMIYVYSFDFRVADGMVDML